MNDDTHDTLQIDGDPLHIDGLTGHLVELLAMLGGDLARVKIRRVFPTTTRDKKYAGDVYLTSFPGLRHPTDADMKEFERRPRRRGAAAAKK